MRCHAGVAGKGTQRLVAAQAAGGGQIGQRQAGCRIVIDAGAGVTDGRGRGWRGGGAASARARQHAQQQRRKPALRHWRWLAHRAPAHPARTGSSNTGCGNSNSPAGRNSRFGGDRGIQVEHLPGAAGVAQRRAVMDFTGIDGDDLPAWACTWPRPLCEACAPWRITPMPNCSCEWRAKVRSLRGHGLHAGQGAALHEELACGHGTGRRKAGTRGLQYRAARGRTASARAGRVGWRRRRARTGLSAGRAYRLAQRRREQRLDIAARAFVAHEQRDGRHRPVQRVGHDGHAGDAHQLFGDIGRQDGDGAFVGHDHFADQLGRVALHQRRGRGQAGPQEDVGHLLADRAVGRAQDPVQIRQYVPFQPRAAQRRQPAAGDEPGGWWYSVSKRMPLRSTDGVAQPTTISSVWSRSWRSRAGPWPSWMVAVMPRPAAGCGRWRPTASGPRRREWRRCSGAPRDRWPGLPFPGPCGPGRGPGAGAPAPPRPAGGRHAARGALEQRHAEHAFEFGQGIGHGRLAGRHLLGDPVSDPCCSICSSSIRCRILSREPSFRTTSSGLNEVIYWGHS